MAIRKLFESLSRHLSRETSSGRFVPEIDGLRFVAIITVMAYHLVGYIYLRHGERYGGEPQLTNFADRLVYETVELGHAGVQLFFAISGFILCLPFAEAHLNRQPQPPLRKYLTRRVTRLEPPYVINLLFWYMAQVLVKGQSAIGLLPNLFFSIIYLHNAVYLIPSRINPVAWSLEIEVQFYLLAPVLAQVFRMRSARYRRALLMIVILILPFPQHGLTSEYMPRVRLSILGELQFFLVGFLLADYYLVSWQQQPQLSRRWDLFGLLGWAAIIALLATSSAMLRKSIGLPMLIAYMAAFRGPIWRSIFRWPPVVIIGGMCYSIYLYQWMGFYSCGILTMRVYDPGRPYWLNYAMQFVLLIPMSLALCTIMFVLFEKPFMRRDWPQRFRRWLGGSKRAVESTPKQLPAK